MGLVSCARVVQSENVEAGVQGEVWQVSVAAEPKKTYIKKNVKAEMLDPVLLQCDGLFEHRSLWYTYYVSNHHAWW